MGYFLGIDTSNYTTSISLYQRSTGSVIMQKKLLPVKEHTCGLRQSEAVFAHIKKLGGLTEELFKETGQILIEAIGYSAFPRRVEGSYMPCFLVGDMVSQVLSAVLKIPRFAFSHQEGHIAAALYSANCLDWLKGSTFYAFHVSGGTTELLQVDADGANINTKLLAKTLDLNAGQIIDRVGVMLGLGFPCGNAMEQLAECYDEPVKARAVLKGADCCLSGLENQCAALLKDGKPKEYIAKFCLSCVQQTVKEMTEYIFKSYGKKPIIYAGGVMSNSMIRLAMEKRFDGKFAEPRFSADNSAGTAVLAALTHEKE